MGDQILTFLIFLVIASSFKWVILLTISVKVIAGRD